MANVLLEGLTLLVITSTQRSIRASHEKLPTIRLPIFLIGHADDDVGDGARGAYLDGAGLLRSVSLAVQLSADHAIPAGALRAVKRFVRKPDERIGVFRPADGSARYSEAPRNLNSAGRRDDRL